MLIIILTDMIFQLLIITTTEHHKFGYGYNPDGSVMHPLNLLNNISSDHTNKAATIESHSWWNKTIIYSSM